MIPAPSEEDLVSTVSHDRLERKVKEKRQAHEW